jgi:SAM-dependent methyltransferase
MATERPYLDYYGEHGIIPVRQDTADLPLHMARRRSLYRHLGLLPASFRDRRVLEFGPGTGDNALYVASCGPESYVLVDGNPASIRAIEEKLERGMLPRDRVVCRESDILSFTFPTPFDAVLCEGVLGGQRDTEAFLGHVASFVAPEGVLAITTMSPTSLLAEACRRVLKPIFAERFRDEARLVQELVAFFEPDLRSLPGMSRLHEDWVGFVAGAEVKDFAVAAFPGATAPEDFAAFKPGEKNDFVRRRNGKRFAIHFGVLNFKVAINSRRDRVTRSR